MENNRDYDLSWYKLDHLKQKDKVLLDTVKDEYREIIERAQSRLPGSYVDLEWITSELKIDLEYPDNMISDVYGSISANGKGGYRIEIRKSDSPTRQRFTLAHELAHYLLHIDPKYPDLSVVAEDNPFRADENIFLVANQYTRSQEWQANAFAAHILMPMEKLDRIIVRDEARNIGDLARIFNVSSEAIADRMRLPVLSHY